MLGGKLLSVASAKWRWFVKNRVAYWLLGVLALAGVFWLDHVSPPPPSPSGFWEILFANRLVFAITRVAIVFAAGYVVYSVIHNVSRGLPLRELAGAKVASRVREEATALRQTHENVVWERDALRDQLARTNETIDRLSALLEVTAREKSRLEEQLNPKLSGTLAPGTTGVSRDDDRRDQGGP